MSSKVDRFPQVGHSVLGYSSRLLRRTWVAQNTVPFRFQRPRNSLFPPGQFIDLILPAIPTVSRGLAHTFLIASPCFAPYILVVTRMRDSPFKSALSVLPLGTEVGIRGPMGSIIPHTDLSGMSNRSFHFAPTFTRIGPGYVGWKGATGPISVQMLSKHVNNLRDPIYYVAGPSGMVSGAYQTLVELGVSEENIQTEHFAGY